MSLFDTITSAVGEVAGVVKGAVEFNIGDPRPEMAHDEEVQAKLLRATEEIPNQDIIYEQLAHSLAYGKYDVKQLKAWGYGAPQIVVPLNPTTGMFVVAVEPDKSMTPAERKEIEAMHGQSLRTVLAFRGSTDAVCWRDDFSPEGVGAFHFAAHQAEIAAGIAKHSGQGPPDVTGHSLGGALAQMAATVGSVNRIVTFQSPGIPPELAEQVAANGVEATHHRAAEDFVAWVGGEHVEGDEYIYDMAGSSVANAHPGFLLGGLNELRGGDIPMLTDNMSYVGDDYDLDGQGSGLNPWMTLPQVQGDKMNLAWVSKEAPDWNMNGETDWYEQAYDDARLGVVETGRTILGEGLSFADNALEGLDEMAAAEQGNSLSSALAWCWQKGRETLYDGDASGAFGNTFRHLSSGDEMNVKGTDMELFVDLWGTIEPRIGAVPEEELFAEIDAAGFADPALADQMKSQVVLTETLGQCSADV